MENHKRHPFEVITSSDFCAEAVMIPVSDKHKMLIMQAEEFTGLDIDLFTYLTSFLRT
jgi:hypothetical protein